MALATTARSMPMRPSRWARLIPIVAGTSVGLSALMMPPSVVFATPMLLLGLWLVARWPEYGILAILVSTSSIVSAEVLPPIPFGAVSLYVSDLLVLYLFAVLGLRVIVTRGLTPRQTPIDLPVLIFVAICIGSTAVAIAQGHTPFHDGVRSLRHTGYLVIFFLVTNLMESEAQMQRLWAGVMLIATLTAVASLLQTVFGPDLVFIPGRVESLHTQGVIHTGVARVIPPGESLFYVVTILSALALSEARANSRLHLGRLALVGAGLLLTYRRMLWGSAILAMAAAVLMMSPAQRLRLLSKLSLIALACSIALTLLFISTPDSKAARSLQATGERIASIFTPDLYRRGDPDQKTLEQRMIENRYALELLKSPTLFGDGLASTYRPCLNLDFECNRPTYLHNGYLAIVLRLGILGFAVFIWIVVGTLRVGFRAQPLALSPASKGNPWSARMKYGCTLAFVGLLPAMVLEPYLFVWHWTPVIAILLATIQWIGHPPTRIPQAVAKLPIQARARLCRAPAFSPLASTER